MSLEIITNNVPRDIIYGYELTDEEQKDFDYLDYSQDGNGNGDCRQFARYKGNLIDLDDMMSTSGILECGESSELRKWDGYAGDSFFSGIVIRYPREDWGDMDTDHVICGTYIS